MCCLLCDKSLDILASSYFLLPHTIQTFCMYLWPIVPLRKSTSLKIKTDLIPLLTATPLFLCAKPGYTCGPMSLEWTSALSGKAPKLQTFILYVLLDSAQPLLHQRHEIFRVCFFFSHNPLSLLALQLERQLRLLTATTELVTFKAFNKICLVINIMVSVVFRQVWLVFHHTGCREFLGTY